MQSGNISIFLFEFVLQALFDIVRLDLPLEEVHVTLVLQEFIGPFPHITLSVFHLTQIVGQRLYRVRKLDVLKIIIAFD